MCCVVLPIIACIIPIIRAAIVLCKVVSALCLMDDDNPYYRRWLVLVKKDSVLLQNTHFYLGTSSMNSNVKGTGDDDDATAVQKDPLPFSPINSDF